MVIDVNLPSVLASSNTEVIIPIDVQGVENKGIISYEFDLRYDPTVLQPVHDPINIAGTVSRGLSFVANADEPGILRIAVYGPMPIRENGILLNLKFITIGAVGSVSPLIWEKIMFNDGEPRTAAANGWVKINYSPR